MNRIEITARLRKYIVNELLDGDGKDLEPTTPLLQWGILDSIGIVSLLSFIEEDMGIEVPDQSVRPEYFESIEHLATMLEGLKDQAA